MGKTTMLAGLHVEIRHGDDDLRRKLRVHLMREHCMIVEEGQMESPIIVDLDGCETCALGCTSPGTGPVVIASGPGSMRISARLSGPLLPGVVAALLLVSGALQGVPIGNPAFRMGTRHRHLAEDAQGHAMHLSQREHQVVLGVLAGKSNKEIARALGITETTIKVHMKSVLRKIGAENRTQVALWAVDALPEARHAAMAVAV